MASRKKGVASRRTGNEALWRIIMLSTGSIPPSSTSVGRQGAQRKKEGHLG